MRFRTLKGGVFEFEHSLDAISKWESIWKIAYLNVTEHTEHQLLDYYICMCRTGDIEYDHLTPQVIHQLSKYMNDSQSATEIQNGNNSSTRGQKMTSEVIYALMANAGVPFSCDQWNINRLLKVLNIISIQNSPKKKMPHKEVVQQNRDLNAERKKKYNTKG